MVKEGEKAPEIELEDDNGNAFRLSEHIGKAWIVVYFYPRNETPGCTAQACTFRDHYEEFTDLGAKVIGISSGSVDSHRSFKGNHSLPFTLLSDAKGKARQAFKVPRSLGLLPGRVTYVIDHDGIVRSVFNSQTKTKEHIFNALEIIKEGNK